MNQQLTTTAKEKISTIMAMLEARKGQFRDLLPKYLTPEKLFRVAQTSISKSPQLLNCTPASLCIALMDAAQTGLEVNGKDAALVPYGNQCQFQPMYQGMVKQAVSEGAAKKIQSRLVYANDDFELWYDPEPHIKHIPAMEEEGEVIGAYAYAILPDGDMVLEYMNKRKLDHIRNRAKSKGGPWSTDEEEMYRKTPTKRLFKYLPIPERLEYAIAIDNRNEAGASNIEVPLLDMPPAELQEPKQTATEKLVEKTKRGRKPKVQTSPEPPQATISSEPESITQENVSDGSMTPLNKIRVYCKSLGLDAEKIALQFGAESLEKLTSEQTDKMLSFLLDADANPAWQLAGLPSVNVPDATVTILDEIRTYCKSLGLNPDKMALQFGSESVDKLDQEQTNKLLNFLMDAYAKSEE